MSTQHTVIQQRVIDCLTDTLSLNEEEVTLDADLRDDLNIDSLEAAEAAMALELEFEIEDLAVENLEKQKTVEDLANFIEKQITPELATAQT